MQLQTDSIDTDIRIEARVKFRATRAEVFSVIERYAVGGERDVPWWWLSVDGEIIARRRTKAELLEMLRQAPVRTVGAWFKERYRTSTRTVGAR